MKNIFYVLTLLSLVFLVGCATQMNRQIGRGVCGVDSHGDFRPFRVENKEYKDKDGMVRYAYEVYCNIDDAWVLMRMSPDGRQFGPFSLEDSMAQEKDPLSVRHQASGVSKESLQETCVGEYTRGEVSTQTN